MSLPRYPAYKPSGVDWLGEVPEHWAVKCLKQACHVFPSNVDKKSHDGEMPVTLCNYTDVYYNETITADMEFMAATASTEQIAKFTLRAGDTIITKDSETADDIAIAAYVPVDLPNVVCGYHLSMIRPKTGTHGAFVKRLFDSTYVKSCVEVRANGLTRVGLGQYQIDNLDLPFPPIDEQQTIAAFLDRETGKIDALIAAQRRLVGLLAEKRQAVISHAVTKGISTLSPARVRPLSPDPSPARGEGSGVRDVMVANQNAQPREGEGSELSTLVWEGAGGVGVNQEMTAARQLPCEVAGRAFSPSSDIAPPPSRGRGWGEGAGWGEGVAMKDSGIAWLGDVPAHWEVVPLKRICELLKDGTHLPPPRVAEGVPLLSVRNIQNGQFDLRDDDSLISEDDYRVLCKAFTPQPNDVLLAIVGATLGKTALVPNGIGLFHIQRSVAIFRPTVEMQAEYLHLLFQSIGFQKLLWEYVGFSAQPGIYLGTLAEFRVTLPPLAEQHAIAAFLDEETAKFDTLTAEANRAIALLQERRSALISAAVTGKIDVRSAG